MKKIAILLIITAILASCSSSGFKIDGNIANLEGDAVRVLFRADSGVVDERVTADRKGEFTFKGESTNPVLVSVLSLRGEPLAMMVAVNGDRLKLSGDASKAMGVKVSGNHLNEEWQLFRDEHGSFYTDPNPSRLNAAIEKYVREHPSDLLSTVLLMADYTDYSDRAKVEKLLGGIDGKCRPESLTEVFTGLSSANASNRSQLPRLMSLTLIKHGSEFEKIDLMGHVTLLNLWAKPQTERDRTINAIKALEGAGKSAVKVIDVLIESDSLRWHETIANDPQGWSHYWAPGGPLEPGIQLLRITSAPWYAVVDSAGLIAYSGPSLDNAIKHLK